MSHVQQVGHVHGQALWWYYGAAALVVVLKVLSYAVKHHEKVHTGKPWHPGFIWEVVWSYLRDHKSPWYLIVGTLGLTVAFGGLVTSGYLVHWLPEGAGELMDYRGVAAMFGAFMEAMGPWFLEYLKKRVVGK